MRLVYFILLVTGLGLLWLLTPAARAQQGQPLQIYQLSGMILDKGNGVPVAYAKIYINQRRRFALTSEEGFFSIPVVATDTLYFRRIGYKPTQMVVSQYLKEYGADTGIYLYEVLYMTMDPQTLPTVNIYPYRSPEDIKMAILRMPPGADAGLTASAQGNVSPTLLAYMKDGLPEDEADRLAVAQQRYQNYYTSQNLQANVPLVDPVAVYKMIKYMEEKKQERRQRILQYWND